MELLRHSNYLLFHLSLNDFLDLKSIHLKADLMILVQNDQLSQNNNSAYVWLLVLMIPNRTNYQLNVQNIR